MQKMAEKEGGGYETRRSNIKQLNYNFNTKLFFFIFIYCHYFKQSGFCSAVYLLFFF